MKLRAGILLSRTPVVTKQTSSFEKAYFKYQDELERRLMWTFPWYFYFKKGTLAQRKFNDLQTGPTPRHKGVYYPKGIPDVKHNRERRRKQEVVLPTTEGLTIDKVARSSEHDQDETSLARKLDSTLYLVVNRDGKWRFPSFEVAEAEALHEAAERGLRELGGDNINTWTVSNTPAAVIKEEVPEFLIRSHILHGQFQPEQQKFGWLTKSELEQQLDQPYYHRIATLLV